MARTVLYTLYSTATATGAGTITAQIARDGRIKGSKISLGVEGAAGTTAYIVEGNLNAGTTNNTTSNNPAREMAFNRASSVTMNGTGTNVDTGFVPADIPVVAGDTLGLAYSVVTTAPTSARVRCDILVQE